MQAQDIIISALRKLFVVRTGQTPSTPELADGLNALNRMIANWNTERLIVTAMTKFSGTLVTAQQSYTIGQSGSPDFSTARPIAIDSANIITATGGFVKPLELVDEIGWSQMAGRSRQANIPLKLFYQATYPNGTLWLFPTPNVAATLELWAWGQIAQFATLTANFDLQPGYEQAIIWNLAEQLGPEMRHALDPSGWQEVQQTAARTKSAISGVNAPPVPGMAESLEASGANQPVAPRQ